MYKSIKFKNLTIAVNRFPATARRVSNVYLTGIRNWKAQDANYYSLVIGRFRVMLSINKNIGECCNG